MKKLSLRIILVICCVVLGFFTLFQSYKQHQIEQYRRLQEIQERSPKIKEEIISLDKTEYAGKWKKILPKGTYSEIYDKILTEKIVVEASREKFLKKYQMLKNALKEANSLNNLTGEILRIEKEKKSVNCIYEDSISAKEIKNWKDRLEYLKNLKKTAELDISQGYGPAIGRKIRCKISRDKSLKEQRKIFRVCMKDQVTIAKHRLKAAKKNRKEVEKGLELKRKMCLETTSVKAHVSAYVEEGFYMSEDPLKIIHSEDYLEDLRSRLFPH